MSPCSISITPKRAHGATTNWPLSAKWRAEHASPLNDVEQKPISVTLNDQGQVFLMDQPVPDAEVMDKLRELAKDGPDARVYVRASKIVPYGRVAQIMGQLTTAGYKKVALVTDPTTSTP